jgi:hypothetical protein
MERKCLRLALANVTVLATCSSAALSGQSIIPADKIAFVSASCASNGGGPCLATMDADGTNLVELTSTDAIEPVWSGVVARWQSDRVHQR